jgi:competence protein ComGC
MRRAFTVVELLIAVVVMLAVIIATSKIFNTASKVSSTGEANADVLQQGTVIEEQMRRDLERLCRDGYMAIQCVAVRNDVNQVISPSANAPLLNPQLDANAILRCDQIVFFTAGTETSARWAGPGDLVSGGGGQQSRGARVYYGHGVQFPSLPNDPTSNPPGSNPNSIIKPIITGVSPTPSGLKQVVPWTWFDPLTYQLGWQYGTTTQTAGPRVLANQPEARQWVLARKSVLLSDDGGRPIYYPEPSNLTLAGTQGPSSAPSIFGDRSNTGAAGSDPSYFQEMRDRNRISTSTNLIPSPVIQSGWVDVAASDFGKIRREISPTLRLQTPLPVGGGAVTLSSMSVPFNTPGNGIAPISWPVGAGAPAWPSGSAIVAVGNNMDPGAINGFSTQRDRIMRGTFGIPATTNVSNTFGLLGWPRSEKSIGNTDRKSEMLTSPTLVTNCSTFQVDWTWEPLTGRQTDSSGAVLPVTARLSIGAAPTYAVTPTITTLLRGYEPFADTWPANAEDPTQRVRQQPWFGFPDSGDGPVVIPASQQLGVALAQDTSVMPDVPNGGSTTTTVRTNFHMRAVAQAIEGTAGAAANSPAAIQAPFGAGVPVRVYTAVFGFNQDEAYAVTPDGFIVAREDYTPWPTQIRITATIHDPRLVLDRGREFQFVLDVPKRRKD